MIGLHDILFFMIKRTAPIIVGNWKSTPKTLDEGIKFIKQLEKKIETMKIKFPKKGYYLAVPEIFIPSLAPLAKRGYIGAQTIPGTTLGQITGQTTPSQLVSGGAAFAIVGHSEVRARGETKEERAEKVLASLSMKCTTIFCLGEKKRDKEGKYLEELENDIKHTLSEVQREYFGELVVAYEPVWAIGAPEPATAPECFEAVIAIRRALASLGGIDYAKKVHILYGGAITKDTVKTFLEEGGVDGLLIGRASQEVSSFIDILNAAHAN
jgi:triosephosphate isomerase